MDLSIRERLAGQRRGMEGDVPIAAAGLVFQQAEAVHGPARHAGLGVRVRTFGVAVLGLAGVVAAACASPAGDPWEHDGRSLAARAAVLSEALPRRREPPEPGDLRVHLVFGAEADLDLYVTDPQQETVYFANPRSRAGGVLAADRTCGAGVVHIETVTFSNSPPGRYRVGVDFPARCDGRDGPVPFLVVVGQNGRLKEQRGTIELLRFQPVVLEFDFRGNVRRERPVARARSTCMRS